MSQALIGKETAPNRGGRKVLWGTLTLPSAAQWQRELAANLTSPSQSQSSHLPTFPHAHVAQTFLDTRIQRRRRQPRHPLILVLNKIIAALSRQPWHTVCADARIYRTPPPCVIAIGPESPPPSFVAATLRDTFHLDSHGRQRRQRRHGRRGNSAHLQG